MRSQDMKSQTRTARLVTILEDVTVKHRLLPDRSKDYVLSEGNQYGNVHGHTTGVQISENQDGTVDMTLRTELTDVWYNVPKSALLIEWMD